MASKLYDVFDNYVFTVIENDNGMLKLLGDDGCVFKISQNSAFFRSLLPEEDVWEKDDVKIDW